MTDRFTILPIAAAIIAVSALVAGTKAKAHVSDSGQVYPNYCCHSAAESPSGDCAPIASKFVTEQPDGYHVNIPAGGHPQLKKQSYSGVIPYGDAKKSDDGQPHICLAYEGTSRFCFFMPPRLG